MILEMKMKKLYRVLLIAIVLQAALVAEGFKLESSDISEQLSVDQVYRGYGCHGNNISPELRWSGEPRGTKSFAVTLYDPDAPTGRGWWHWIVFNIPASVHELPRGAGDPKRGKLPRGAVQSITDFGTIGFGGACPPKGDRPHRYIFTVYALDVDHLSLDPNTSPAKIGSVIGKHALAKASLMARYGR